MQKEFYKKHDSFFSLTVKKNNILNLTLKRISQIYQNKLGLKSLSKKHQIILNQALKII